MINPNIIESFEKNILEHFRTITAHLTDSEAVIRGNFEGGSSIPLVSVEILTDMEGKTFFFFPETFTQTDTYAEATYAIGVVEEPNAVTEQMTKVKVDLPA